MSTATNDMATTSAAQILQVMKNNRILCMQALVLCKDGMISRWLARDLFDMGIAPQFFDEAEAALEVLNHNRFDLVVVDCDGVEEGMAQIGRAHV